MTLNKMCETCARLGNDCKGTTCQDWTGCVSRQEDKEKRIFNHYKTMLTRLSARTTPGQLRFLVIEYQCSFPGIDPYKMAVALAAEGFRIVFDNSALSAADNRKAQRKFEKLCKEAA